MNCFVECVILKMQVLCFYEMFCGRWAASFSSVAWPQKEVKIVSMFPTTLLCGELVLALVFGLFHCPSICLFDLLSSAFGNKNWLIVV